MVVLDEDPLEIDKVKIKDIEILATIVGDKIVSGGF
jgi:predicted amidohydrolase YtcJ